MNPIPPQSILFMIQNGWAADVILGLTVDSMNGLRSRTHAGYSTRSGDTDFYRCLFILRELQKSGSIGLRIIEKEHESKATVMFLHKKGMDPDQLELLKEAFASVNYHDQWFWIEDSDFKSKRTFAFLMILSSITESGGQEGLPLVTLLAG